MIKIVSLSLAVGFLLLGGNGCQDEKASSEKKEKTEKNLEEYYTCAMHPQIKEDKPGKCPICHMTLTKVVVERAEGDKKTSSSEDHSEHVEAKANKWKCKNYPDVTSEVKETCPIDGTPMVKVEDKNKLAAGKAVAQVKLRESQLDHFKASLFPVTTMKMTRQVRLLGNVLQSEDRESSIPARVSGRVEKVYVKSTGSFIKKGDPAVDLYSPKLISAGEEFLIAKKSYQKSKTKEFKDLLKQSEERLKLWGIQKEQYIKWAKEDKVPRAITIYSPATGIVRKRNAIVGKYFKEGQNFFELSDLSYVWVELDVYEQDAGLVDISQRVLLKFSALPGVKIYGNIDFVNPVLEESSRTLKIRTTIKNEQGKLKPGMVADATLTFQLEGMPLVVPRSAIIDTGKRKVVWLKLSESKYQAVTIQTGYESSGYVEVRSGLKEGDQVILEGNFLLDAQAQLFGGYEEMNMATQGHNH